MKPVELMVRALAAAAKAGSERVIASGAKESYSLLYAATRERLGADPSVLDRHTVDPDAGSTELIEALNDTDAAEDASVRAAAEDVLDRLRPGGPHLVADEKTLAVADLGATSGPEVLRIGVQPGIVALVAAILIGLLVAVFALIRAYISTPTQEAAEWGAPTGSPAVVTTNAVPTTTTDPAPAPVTCEKPNAVVRFQGTPEAMTIFVDRCVEPPAGRHLWLMAVSKTTGRKPSTSFYPLADVANMPTGANKNQSSLKHNPEDPKADRCYQVFQTNERNQADFERRGAEGDKGVLVVAGTRLPVTLKSVSDCVPFAL